MKYRRANDDQQPCTKMSLMASLSLKNVHPSWLGIIQAGLNAMDKSYQKQLLINAAWLPGQESLLNAFSVPLEAVQYVLFGESPYPRQESANGYAFWDQAVDHVWSQNGLSKPVNKATSLRNFMKMLLVSQNLLTANDTSQQAIAKLDKSDLIATLHELFQNFFSHGFLLLNTSLVLSKSYSVAQEARYWQPFMVEVLQHLHREKSSIKLLLFGKVADKINKLPGPEFDVVQSEHPYNPSFIQNKEILNFFKPIPLLRRPAGCYP